MQPCQDAYAKVTEPKIRVVEPSERAMDALVSSRALERRSVVCFVAETQDVTILVGQIAEKCRIEEQRMVAIRLDIVLLEPNDGVVIVEEHHMSRLQHRNSLPMDAGGVE
jgi:hypothetical protein